MCQVLIGTAAVSLCHIGSEIKTAGRIHGKQAGDKHIRTILPVQGNIGHVY